MGTDVASEQGIPIYGVKKDFLLEVRRGNIPGASIVQKFGQALVGTTLAPVAFGNVYQMPIAATALEIVSDSGNDTALGSGATELTIIGIGSDFLEKTVVIPTAGVTPVAIGSFLRVYRAFVSGSGTYASQSTMSHDGVILIRVASAGATWATITEFAAGKGFSQTQIGWYTVPADKTAYCLSRHVTVDSTKVIDAFFFQRGGIDVVSAPFTPMRLVQHLDGIGQGVNYQPYSPLSVFPGKTDIGFMGKVAAGTGSISVDFQLLLIQTAVV